MIRKWFDAFESIDGKETLQRNIDLIIITTFVVIDWAILRAIIWHTSQHTLHPVTNIHPSTFNPKLNIYGLKKWSILSSIILFLALFAIAKRLE